MKSVIFVSFFLLTAALTLNATPPSISFQPQSQTNVAGAQAIFTVAATGTAPLGYQWSKNGAPIPGATNYALVFNQTHFTNAGIYSVTVSNAENIAVSPNATLVVSSPVGGEVDYLFNPGAGLNERVNASVVQPDGKVIIVGAFTSVNGAERGGVARLNADGTTDLSFMNGVAGANNYVFAVALQPDGKIIVGGQFSRLNGALRFNIARLNADGSLDTGFGNTTGANSAVSSVALQTDGKVLIGGIFTSVNGAIRQRIARLNSDGTTDTTFQNGLLGASAEVRAIAVQTNGNIIIGGSFTSVNGTNRGGIARLGTNGVLDTTFQNGMTGASGNTFGTTAVNSLALQTNGAVVIGGDFTSINGTNRGGIARLNTDGSLDTTFLNGLTGANDPVNQLYLQSDGKVVLGGYFSTINGTSRSRIARINTNGIVDTGFLNLLSGADNSVLSVASQTGNKVLVGGFFTAVNGVKRRAFAQLNSDGTTDTGFSNAPSGLDNLVRSVAVQSDRSVLIGGDFTTISGTNRARIARLKADGTLDTNYLNGLAGANGGVTASALQSDGKLLIGGFFTTVNGVSRARIARLNTDGTLDTGFLNGLSGAASTVNAIAVQSDNAILIGGAFTTVNGTNRNRIARLNSDGTLDMVFQNGLAGPSGAVNAIAVQADGAILIGGTFITVNGVSRTNIARLNSIDGSLDAGFLNGLSGPNGAVNAIAVQDDGKIVIGGSFTTVNGATQNRIARLNTNGTFDVSFSAGTAAANSAVYALALQTDGKILLGGVFGSYDIITRNGIARLKTDGTLDDTFQNGMLGANVTIGVRSIALSSDGEIVLGGDFGGINAQPRTGVARLYPGMATPRLASSAIVTNGTYQLGVTHLPGSTNVVEGSAGPLGSWAPLQTNIAPFTFTDSDATNLPYRFYRTYSVP